MSETPESRTEPTAVATAPRWDRTNRLSQVAAWVGIVAGVLFIVAVVFFSGFFIGSGGYFGCDHRGDGYWTYYHGGPPVGPGMMGPYGPIGPGGMMGPGGQWGPYGPGQQPSTSAAPTAPSPPRP